MVIAKTNVMKSYKYTSKVLQWHQIFYEYFREMFCVNISRECSYNTFTDFSSVQKSIYIARSFK